MGQTRDSKTVPDGTPRAWLTCLGSFFLLLNTFGLTNSYGMKTRRIDARWPSFAWLTPWFVGAFQTFYATELLKDFSPSQIAWIGSVQTFLLISLGIFTGPVYDRGHLGPLLWGGGLLVVVGTICTGLGSQYWQLFLAQGLVVGMGAGLLFLPSIAILAQYFNRNLALATGVASSGGAIGSIVYSIAFNQLQPQIGFRYATWTIALMMLVTMLISCSVLRLRLHHLKARKLFDAQAFKEAPFCLWSSHLFVSMLGLYAPSFYIQTFGLQYMAPSTAFYLLPVLNAGSFFGRIIPLFAADHLGYFNVLVTATSLASATGFAWLAVKSVTGCFLFSAFYGFLAGCITTISAPIEVTMCPSDDVVGVRLGMFLFPWAVGFLIGNPIAGAVLGSQADWKNLQVYVGAVIAVAAALGVAARWVKHRALLIC